MVDIATTAVFVPLCTSENKASVTLQGKNTFLKYTSLLIFTDIFFYSHNLTVFVFLFEMISLKLAPEQVPKLGRTQIEIGFARQFLFFLPCPT